MKSLNNELTNASKVQTNKITTGITQRSTVSLLLVRLQSAMNKNDTCYCCSPASGAAAAAAAGFFAFAITTSYIRTC